MDTKSTLKSVVTLLVGAGVGQVIDDAVNATAPETVKPLAKVLRKVGAWALGIFVADWASDQTEKLYDTVADSVKQISDKVEEAKNAVEAEDEDDEFEETVDIFEEEMV